MLLPILEMYSPKSPFWGRKYALYKVQNIKTCVGLLLKLLHRFQPVLHCDKHTWYVQCMKNLHTQNLTSWVRRGWCDQGHRDRFLIFDSYIFGMGEGRQFIFGTRFAHYMHKATDDRLHQTGHARVFYKLWHLIYFMEWLDGPEPNKRAVFEGCLID